MESKEDPNIDDDVGCIRWASNSQLSSTPTNEQKSQSNVKIHGEFGLDASLQETITPGNDDRGSFSMDIRTFERNLQAKRDRQMHQSSPRIEIRLRETSTTTPKTHATSLSKINIHHIERGSGIETNPLPGPSTSIDEVDFVSEAPRKVKRVITYEKVLKTKTTREITYPRTHSSSETIQSPTVQRTTEYSTDKSSSTEQMAGGEDSAYHSHRVRLASSGTPTTISISSSSNSLQHGFLSDENVYAQQPIHSSRERMLFERAGSEPPPHFTGNFPGIDKRNIQSSLDSTRIMYDDELLANRQPRIVSPVTDGNQSVRRHFESHRTPSEGGDGISLDWYNEYQTQTVTAVDRAKKMDFKRSNSQYDNHIRQIRGIFGSFIYLFL